MRHTERHRADRIGWLRAAILGANDGIVSTASLVVGIAATGAPRSAVIVAGAAGLVAGAMSMAAGEYVSVSSQADTERADLAREARELAADPVGELAELAGIYQARGVEPELAHQVAEQLMAKGALAAHGRDELGISHTVAARPLQAAWSSAVSFTIGAILPLLVAFVVGDAARVWAVAVAAVVFLAGLGVTGARLGGAPMLKAAARITIWGAFAMGVTALIGWLVGAAV